MSLAKGSSILFIFSKKQLLVLLIFTIFSFISFSFISAHIFMISFLELILGSFCSFFRCFRCKVRLSIWRFSCFLRKDGTAINFPLRAVLLHPTGFELSCFQCYNSNTIQPQETRKTSNRQPNFTPKTTGKRITTTTTKRTLKDELPRSVCAQYATGD